MNAIARLPVVCLLAACAMVRTAPAAPPPPLYRDTAQYPPLPLTWSACDALTQVARVHPHPLLPGRAIASTATGLWITEDAGKTWHELPAGAAGKIGAVSSVVFHPALPDTFYVATQSKGIWVSEDAGKRVEPLGTTANGMAADAVTSLIVYPSDSSLHTLLAVHGEAAGGISRSRDGGKTWDILNAEYFFRRILANSGQTKIFLIGSTKQEPDVQNLYACATLGEYAMELIRDALFTDMTFALIRKSPLYVTTSDSGLTAVDPVTDETKPLGPQTGWASIAATWGPNADTTGLCLYAPARQGLVFSDDDLKNTRADAGAPTGTFIKEGARICPNANGTVFYAVANDALFVGRKGASVPEVTVTPPVFQPAGTDEKPLNDLTLAFREFCRPQESVSKAAATLLQSISDPTAPYRQRQLTLTARLPIGSAAPTSVTVDLSRFGGSPQTPLADNGGHKDGVYSYRFYFRYAALRTSNDDRRRGWPGPVALGVTAVYADGTRQGAVGLLGIYPRIQNYVLWNPYQKDIAFSVEGKVAGTPTVNPPKIHHLAIQAHEGPWSVILPIPYGKTDLTSYQALSFQIKTTQLSGTLSLQLRDAPELAAAVTTERVPLLGAEVKANPGGDFQTVVIPLARCIGESTLQLSKLNQIILSGNGPADFILDSPAVLATAEAQEGATAK